MRKTTTIAAAIFAVTMVMTAPQSAHASIWAALLDVMEAPHYADATFSNLTSRTVKVDYWDETGFSGSKKVPSGKQLTLHTWAPDHRHTYAIRISVKNNGRWIAKDFQYWGSDARVFIDKAGRGNFYMWGYYLR